MLNIEEIPNNALKLELRLDWSEQDTFSAHQQRGIF